MDGMTAVKKRAAKRAAKGPGRPPLPDADRLEAPLRVRFTADERELVEKAASVAGVSVSGYIRDVTLDAARRRVLGRKE
jgi:hypothetical protein